MIDYFSHADGLATFRPVGEYTLVSIVEAVNRAIAQCREQRIGRLLVVTHKVTGVSPPTLVDRFLAVEDWAHVAKGRVVVGLAISAANIHPQKFGVKVAASFGLTLDAFATEAEALEWLSRYDAKGRRKNTSAPQPAWSDSGALRVSVRHLARLASNQRPVRLATGNIVPTIALLIWVAARAKACRRPQDATAC